jgi:hypothetical protein
MKETKETQEQVYNIKDNTEVIVDEQAVEFEMEELEQTIAPGTIFKCQDN